MDFWTNVQAFLSCLFIGCGANEIGIVLANLDLEGSKTLQSKYYYYIDTLTPHIRAVAEDLVSEARENGILLSYEKQLEKRGLSREEIVMKLKKYQK